MKLENFIVKSDRTDPAGERGREADRRGDGAHHLQHPAHLRHDAAARALRRDAPEGSEEAVQETLGVLSRAHGLRGYRETYLLKEAYLSLLPGAPPLVERRRKTLTPVMVDMLPIWGFQSGEGKIPFLTPHNGLVLYDPFDTGSQPNANILVTGTSGAGKSFAVSYLLSAYEVACAGRG